MFGRKVRFDVRLAMVVALSAAMLISVATCSSKPSVSASSPLQKTLREFQISVRLDRTTLSPADFSMKSLQSAWEKHHASLSKNPELNFDFSVHCLDWKRIEAFFEALPQVAAQELESMRGKTIYLNAADIQLCTASPYDASQIKSGIKVALPEGQTTGGSLLMLKLISSVDTTVALGQITQATNLITTLSAEIARDEQALATAAESEKRQLLERIGSDKRQRFSASHAWRINAMALCDNLPGNARFKAMYEAAQNAVQEFAVSTDYLSAQN